MQYISEAFSLILLILGNIIVRWGVNTRFQNYQNSHNLSKVLTGVAYFSIIAWFGTFILFISCRTDEKEVKEEKNTDKQNNYEAL